MDLLLDHIGERTRLLYRVQCLRRIENLYNKGIWPNVDLPSLTLLLSVMLQSSVIYIIIVGYAAKCNWLEKIAVAHSIAADSAFNGHNPQQHNIFNGRSICIQQLSQVCKQTSALPVLTEAFSRLLLVSYSTLSHRSGLQVYHTCK